MTSNIVASHLPCPSCSSSDAYAEYDDGHGYCFSCEHYTPSKVSGHQELGYTYQPIDWRAVSKETFRLFDTYAKIRADGKPVSIGFRYPNGDHKVRSLLKKEFHWVKSNSSEPVGLFGQNKFTPGAQKYVTITEGELDALSLYEVLHAPVVSVQSATSAERDCIGSRSWLNQYERIYIAFDNDANGRDATAKVARLFEYDKVYHVKFTSRKDANEYLVAGEREELKRIWWNSKRYLPENISSTLEEFKKEVSVLPKWGAPYPFKRLTEKTYGLQTGEVVLVTAQEKVGKTAFMHATLHKLLKEQGDDVHIGGLFHEESKQRTLQALAGIELGRPVHLPDSNTTYDQIAEALDKVIRVDDRLHLHSNSGRDDPTSILDTLRFLATCRACKYIIWDHPGMVVFGMGADNERITLDYIASQTERLVQELNFGLMVVCHVNDLGQLRGSRYFGKTCDVRIDLARDTASPDEQLRNTVYVTMPYARNRRYSGPIGGYLFSHSTQRYTEIANDTDPDAFTVSQAA